MVFVLDIFTILLIMFGVEDIGLVVFALYYLIFKDRDKFFCLFFESQKNCSMVTKKLEDGFIRFKKKYFFVDQAKPMQYSRSFGFQNPLIFLKWSDVIPVDVIRKTIQNDFPYMNNTENLTDKNVINELEERIKIDPKFKEKWDQHQKLMKKRPDELTDLEKQTYKEIMQDKVFQSYELREKVTPETLKDVVDSKMASNLLKPISSLDVIMYIIIGVVIGFLIPFMLKATGIIKF